MLVTALEQLRGLTSARKYKDAAGLVYAVEGLACHFQELSHVARVSDLLDNKAAILSELQKQILEDYASLHGPEHLHQTGVEDAAHCVDAMGPSVRREVITQFCLRLLEGYKDIFQPPKEPSRLETAERRFNWLKRSLRDYDEKYASYFPEIWRVQCGLCEHFCHVTRQHLVEVLSVTHHTIDPELMVRILRKSIDFENEMAKKYPVDEVAPDPESQSPSAVGGVNSNGAANLGLKYPDVLGGTSKASSSSGTKRGEDHAQFAPRFRGIISECFDAYLSSWVQHEEKQLLDLLDKAMAPGVDTLVVNDQEDEDEDGGIEPKIIYASAPDLFANMKGTMQKCSGFSTHQILFDVFRSFRKILGVYVDRLEALLPKKVTQGLDPNAVQVACCVIGTAEYCDETSLQFADLLVTVIDSSFADRVDFSHEQDRLRNAMNRAFQVLVQSVNSSLNEAFNKMTNTNWSTFSQDVGDNSPYVGDISHVLSGQFQPIAKNLSKDHYVSYCGKFVTGFVARFISEIYKCRKISEQGAQQLLLDTSFIKTTLLEAPVTAQGSGRQMQPAYMNYVLREMDKAGTMLKVLSSPEIDASAVHAMLGDGWPREDVERLLALRVGYDGEAGLLPAGFDEDRFDNSSMGAGLRSTFNALGTSLGDTLNQNRVKGSENLSKLQGDMKKKLMSINLPGMARK